MKIAINDIQRTSKGSLGNFGSSCFAKGAGRSGISSVGKSSVGCVTKIMLSRLVSVVFCFAVVESVW